MHLALHATSAPQDSDLPVFGWCCLYNVNKVSQMTNIIRISSFEDQGGLKFRLGPARNVKQAKACLAECMRRLEGEREPSLSLCFCFESYQSLGIAELEGMRCFYPESHFWY